jgi:HSP20 family protein
MIRYITSPFREMDRIFTEMSRVVNSDCHGMATDQYRTKDAFVIKMDLPGIDQDSLDINVDAHSLTIQATRTIADTDSQDNGWLSRERYHGRFARHIALDRGLDTSKTEATYTDGVLTLTIPLAAEAQSRKVTVNTGTVTEPTGDQD